MLLPCVFTFVSNCEVRSGKASCPFGEIHSVNTPGTRACIFRVPKKIASVFCTQVQEIIKNNNLRHRYSKKTSLTNGLKMNPVGLNHRGFSAEF